MQRMTSPFPRAIGATLILLFGGVGLISGCAGLPAASTPVATSAAARIQVTYARPENFSENRQFGPQDRYNRVDYLDALREHLIERAAQWLPAGLRLQVTITDIKLAGAYEPWRGSRLDRVRIMKDIYPPRIDLDFKLTDRSGAVLREGSRKLRNLAYLQGDAGRIGDSDPLRYDKALLDAWLRRGPAEL